MTTPIRSLGICVSPATGETYPAAFAVAKSAGMATTTLALDWNQIEQDSFFGGVHYKNDFLAIANAFYPAQNTAVDLILRPINTNQKTLPPNLMARSFDDPIVAVRFCGVLDYVFSQIPNLTLRSLAIGNEVDHYLASSDTLYAQYSTFYRAVSSYARSKRPGLRVGVVATLGGLAGASKARLAALNATSNVIHVTYYPLGTGCMAEDPVAAFSDITALAAACPGKPIIFTECGYPSGPVCGGSEALQDAFVSHVFAAWDRCPQIEGITFNGLADPTQALIDGWVKLYAVAGPAFPDFLGTLGLRTIDGREKPAMATLRAEAKARGWGA